MRFEESSLQQWCVSFLTYKYSHLFCHHSPNEGVRSDFQGAVLKKEGTKKGWPDLEILANGTIYFVEFKTPKGRQSDAQKAVEKVLTKMGYKYMICRTREDFIELCHKNFGEERDPNVERLKEILNS